MKEYNFNAVLECNINTSVLANSFEEAYIIAKNRGFTETDPEGEGWEYKADWVVDLTKARAVDIKEYK